MPDPVSTGTKSPAGVPPAGTGVGDTRSPATGSPPEDDLKFEEDQVMEQDGKKMVPLEALLGEREKWKKRVAAAQTPPVVPQTPPAEEPAEEPGQPLFNWEKLVPQSGGQSPQPVGTQGPPPMDPHQFEDQFRDMLNDKPWQAVMWAMQTGMQYRDRMEGQARQFVPDYGNLPLHEISDQEVQMLASNPYAMKAMIAKAKYGRSAVGQKLSPSVPVAAVASPVPAASPVSPEAIKAAMDLITSLGKSSGVSGEGTGGPSSPPPPADLVELDKDSISYLRSRGYTDDQIKEQAKRIVDIRRKKGQML
jgi:hypothetical protein